MDAENISFNTQNTIQISQILGSVLAHLSSMLQHGDLPALQRADEAMMDL